LFFQPFFLVFGCWLLLVLLAGQLSIYAALLFHFTKKTLRRKMVMPLMIPLVIGIYFLATATLSFARKMVGTKKVNSKDLFTTPTDSASADMIDTACCSENVTKKQANAAYDFTDEHLCAQETIELKPGAVEYMNAYVHRNKNATMSAVSAKRTSVVCTAHDGSCGDTFHHMHAQVAMVDELPAIAYGFDVVPVKLTNSSHESLYIEEGDVLGHIVHCSSRDH